MLNWKGTLRMYVLFSEQVYISGGTEKTQITNRVQCYDHKRNIWTEKPALHTGIIITEAVMIAKLIIWIDLSINTN